MNAPVAATRSRRRPRRQPTALFRGTVTAVARVTPRMARVTVGGAQLREFASAGTDSNVLLYLYEPGTRPPDPLTAESARAAFATARPHMRSYTIRRHDVTAGEIDVDFVLHDDPGPASAWAQRAAVGDELIFVGPSPAYQPNPDASEYLLAGDESALPAIEAILRELPAGARVRALIEVADADERQELSTEADAEVRWLCRNGAPAGGVDLLAGAVAEASIDRAADAWIAGERAAVQAIRRQLLGDAGLPRDRVRASTYWRLGHAGP